MECYRQVRDTFPESAREPLQALYGLTAEEAGGTAVVTREGAFLLDDWRDTDLAIQALSADFAQVTAGRAPRIPPARSCMRRPAPVTAFGASSAPGATRT